MTAGCLPGYLPRSAVENGINPIAQQKDDVDPEQHAIDPADVVILVVVPHPVDAEHHEADRVDEELRPQAEQFADERFGRRIAGKLRDLDVEDHQRHRDGKDTVAQRLDSGLREAAGRHRCLTGARSHHAVIVTAPFGSTPLFRRSPTNRLARR
jgi:hypothetical protein